MNLLIVTFSLRNTSRDYSSFFVALRGNAIQWWHFIEQTCVVTTFDEVATLANKLRPHIEATDSLLVAKLAPEMCDGWLPREAWEWLNGVRPPDIDLPKVFPPLKGISGR
jgi:hypothetical protein